MPLMDRLGYYTPEEVKDFLEPGGAADLSGTYVTVSAFNESVDDRVASLLVAGSGITLSYNDGANTLTVASSITQYTDENARDAIGAALVAGSGITVTVNDGADTITVASTITQYTDEMARDALGVALVAGAGITITPNDGADTITIASTVTQYTDEMARDALGTALTAGTGITITPNDGADTITIATTITQYTDEMARDALGTALTAGTGLSVTPNDGADTITVAVSDADLLAVASSGLAAASGSYATTLSAGSGTFTTATAAMRYWQVGKMVFIMCRVSITTNGTAASYGQVTVPVAARSGMNYSFACTENGVTGNTGRAYVTGGTSNLIWQRYDAAYLGGNGYVIEMTGWYEAA